MMTATTPESSCLRFDQAAEKRIYRVGKFKSERRDHSELNFSGDPSDIGRQLGESLVAGGWTASGAQEKFKGGNETTEPFLQPSIHPRLQVIRKTFTRVMDPRTFTRDFDFSKFHNESSHHSRNFFQNFFFNQLSR